MQNIDKSVLYGIIGLLLGLIIGCLVGYCMSNSRYGYFNNGMRGDMKGKMMSIHKMSNGTIMEDMDSMSMENMMAEMNKALEGKTGDAFDQAFLSEMIVHHKGAVSMAEMVLKNSKRPELIKLANEIISAQNKEIASMTEWQKAWVK